MRPDEWALPRCGRCARPSAVWLCLLCQDEIVVQAAREALAWRARVEAGAEAFVKAPPVSTSRSPRGRRAAAA